MAQADEAVPGPPSPYDYDAVAPAYDRHRRPGGPFVPVLVGLAQACGARRVLEIGAGTGNSAAAFHSAYPCALRALDRSRAMLAEARTKIAGVPLICADAQALPLPDGCVDYIYGVLVLHHMPDLAKVLGECFRILDEGPAAFVTSSHDFIARHPMNAYFPSFAGVDQGRFPSRQELLEAFEQAGFSEVSFQTALAEPETIDGRYVEKVANRFISTYALLPPGEFEEGLARLRRDVSAKGRLEEPMIWESLIVWAHKGR